MKSISLILKLLFVCIPLLAQQLLADAVFRDGDFTPAEWEEITFFTDDPLYALPSPENPSGSVDLQASGGNSDAFRRSTHNVVGGSVIFTGGLKISVSYNPAIDGAIEKIRLKADLRMFSYDGTGYQIVLRQNGKNYYNLGDLFTGNLWKSYQTDFLKEEDFDTNPNWGLPNTNPHGERPDFSSNGAPIQFGYLLDNARWLNGQPALYGDKISLQLGIDNWEVTVISAPPKALSTFINQGSAQRSMIQGIGMTFDRDVSSQLKSQFLNARNIVSGQVFDLSAAKLIFDPRNFSATWMLDKNTAALLPDGNYIAWLENDQMLDASSVGKFSASHVAIDDFTFGFHQLAGDSDGDRDVDFLDASVFRDTLQKSLGDSAYRSQVDFDLNDSVAELDRTRIKTTYFTVLAEQPALHAYLRTDDGTSQTDNKSSHYDVGVGIVGQSKFVKLEARLDARSFVDVTAQTTPSNKAMFSESIMDGLSGSVVGVGTHRLDVRALDANGQTVAEESLTFERLPVVNFNPYFISQPVTGAITRLVELPTAVDLSKWTVVPYIFPNFGFGSPEWVLEQNNTAARQRVNITASTLLSDFDSANSSIKGSWRVDTGEDDDFMGFVFGFQNDQQFYLFDWKQQNQDGHAGGIGGLAERGMSVKKVKAVPSLDDLWRTEGTGNVDILYHNIIPWEHSVDYDFTLDFFPPNIDIIVKKGDVVVATIQVVDSTYGNGGFGFYNLSQEQVLYRGFTRSQFPEQTYSYQVKAIDPDNDPVTYSLVQGPVGLQIDSTSGLLTWAPATAQVGSHRVTVRASDGKGGTADQIFTIGIVATDSPPSATLATTAAKINIGESYSVKLTATDDIGIASSQVTLNGVPLSLDLAGNYSGTTSSKGKLFFAATVTDTKGQTATARAEIIVDDPSNPDVPGDGTVTGPTVDIGSGSGPSPLVEISAPNGTAGEDLGKFIGTVNPNGGTLANWRLDYAPQATVNLNNLIDPAVSWVSIAAGTDVKNNAPLGNIDSTLLANANFVFRLLAYNTSGKGAVTTVIFNPRDTAIPKIAFTAPVVGSEISYQTEIKATIDPDGGTIDRWILDYAQAAEVSLELLSNPSVKWTEMARGNTAKTDAAIGTLDATMLRNDSYVLRIRAWNTNGRGYQLGGIFNVTSQSKLGNFRVEFTDLSIPLQGIPIQVTRIYDSLETGRFNDFGYGWSLGLCDADIRETVPDTGGDIFTATPFKVGTRVYLTTPEGKRVGFTFKLRNPQSSFFFTTWEPYFEPDRGVYEKLTLGSADNTRVSQVSDGSVVYPLFQFGFNPNDYLLTLQNGTVYHYDQRQGLKDVTDLNGNTATFTDSGIRHSSGVAIDFVRDTQGRITSIKAPNGTQIGYVYDANGDLIEVTNQLGAKTSFGYYATPAHYLEKITNPNDLAQGRFTQKILYDANGRVSQVQDGDGNVFAKQDFVPGSFTGTRTDGRGFVTNLTYDRRGNLLSEQTPEGGITRYEYSDPANPDKETAIIDPLTHRREFTYDSQGNRLTEKDPLGNLTIYGYNSLGKITSLTRKNAANVTLSTESAEYDADGNLTKLINCAGESRTFAYVSGRLVASTDFEGNATQYDYTNGCPCGSPSKIIYPDTTTKLFEYNAYGQVTKVTDETGAISRFLYDAIGRKTQEIDHDGKATFFVYDDNNNLVKRTDRLGRISKFEYNAKNLLVKEIKILTDDGNDADDVILSYEYDEDDRLETLVDPMANRTEFAYDRDGRLSTRKDALGKFSQVFYDLAGNTEAVVDRNGRKRSFDYDARNLPTKEFWHAPNDSIVRTISIGYDDLGRRSSISDSDSTYGFTYDVCSRLETETNAGTPSMPAVSFTYGYDKDGNRTTVTDNTGVSVTTGFDSRGRSASFKWQGGGIAAASVDLDRNGRGQMTAIKRFNDGNLGNIVSQTTYDQIAPQGWVKQVQHKNNLGNLYNSGSNFTYGYDSEGQVTSQASQGNSTIYSYDLTGQITGANHTAAAYPDESYQYDKAGNRISSHLHASYTTGTANRLQSDGQFSYSYDDEGNTITKTEIATGKVTSYIYDHRGRVTSLTERASAGGAITSEQNFTHDVLDRRIGIVANGVETRISYLDENAWADYNAAGVATKRYLFADRIDGNLANWTATNGTQWYLTDKLGSIRALATSGGALGTNVGYDSFGNNLAGSGIFATERFGFTGRENVAAGTNFHRSRLYNSGAGRFVGEDPIESAGETLNKYRYALNQPTDVSDPTGRNAIIGYLISDQFQGGLGYLVGGLSSFGATNLDYISAVLEGNGSGFITSDIGQGIANQACEKFITRTLERRMLLAILAGAAGSKVKGPLDSGSLSFFRGAGKGGDIGQLLALGRLYSLGAGTNLGGTEAPSSGDTVISCLQSAIEQLIR